MYSQSVFSRKELESALNGLVSPLDLNRIIAAYDMAESVHARHYLPNGVPSFFHTSRVCKIIIEELEIFDPTVVISALLHDIDEGADKVSRDIIRYNFGSVVASLVDLLCKEINTIEDIPLTSASKDKKACKLPGDDYMIICLADNLDDIRCLEFDPRYSPVQFINKIVEIIIPIAEKKSETTINYLISEIKKELSKFYC